MNYIATNLEDSLYVNEAYINKASAFGEVINCCLYRPPDCASVAMGRKNLFAHPYMSQYVSFCNT